MQWFKLKTTEGSELIPVSNIASVSMTHNGDEIEILISQIKGKTWYTLDHLTDAKGTVEKIEQMIGSGKSIDLTQYIFEENIYD